MKHQSKAKHKNANIISNVMNFLLPFLIYSEYLAMNLDAKEHTGIKLKKKEKNTLWFRNITSTWSRLRYYFSPLPDLPLIFIDLICLRGTNIEGKETKNTARYTAKKDKTLLTGKRNSLSNDFFSSWFTNDYDELRLWGKQRNENLRH